mmetsp:Transcript_83914/g.238006  ORF Transcript_83914/g.238006 Transcript_83914/m.238006 type:complete len:304 (-) Transcript_83914:476-1387(-)
MALVGRICPTEEPRVVALRLGPPPRRSLPLPPEGPRLRVQRLDPAWPLGVHGQLQDVFEHPRAPVLQPQVERVRAVVDKMRQASAQLDDGRLGRLPSVGEQEGLGVPLPQPGDRGPHVRRGEEVVAPEQLAARQAVGADVAGLPGRQRAEVALVVDGVDDAVGPEHGAPAGPRRPLPHRLPQQLPIAHAEVIRAAVLVLEDEAAVAGEHREEVPHPRVCDEVPYLVPVARAQRAHPAAAPVQVRGDGGEHVPVVGRHAGDARSYAVRDPVRPQLPPGLHADRNHLPSFERRVEDPVGNGRVGG